jgi:hypothetical protein
MKALLPVTAIAFGICVGLALLQRVLKLNEPEFNPLELVRSAVQAFLLTPYFIAVHRFIILHEATQGYELAPSQTRFQRFFGWSVALSLVWFVVSLIGTLTEPSIGLHVIVVFALLVIGAIVSLRLITLFPAIAVDAPGASWKMAAATTRGHAWHILGVLILSALPMIVPAVAGLLIGFWLNPATRFPAWTAVEAIAGGAVSLLSITIGIAVASRLFQRLGERAA